MSIEAAISDLQAKALALSGMRTAPATPLESSDIFPFAITFEESGTLELRSSGFAHDLATLVTEIHCARNSLPQAITQAMTFRDNFLKAIIGDPRLSNSVDTALVVLRKFGAMRYAETDTIGYRFEVDVKVQLTT